MRHNPLGPIEPPANIRHVTTVWFQTYAAAVGAGFTPAQAMDIVTTLIEATVTAAYLNDDD